MTCCKYKKNRKVAITYNNNLDLFEIDHNYFHILFIKSGYVHCAVNATHCFVNSRSILVLSRFSKYKFIRYHNLEAVLLSFAPDFINVNLNWETIESVGYPVLRKEHNYPEFKLFMNIDDFFGILNLTDEQCCETEILLLKIQEQLENQPDHRWSCWSRSYLFKLIARLELLQMEYLSGESPDELVVKVCNYIMSHLSCDLSVEFLCRQFATNHTTLFNKFTAYTGMPVSAYITQKRLESAKKDLAFTSLMLTEIATENGFGTSSYFTRVFKQNFGVTPLKYRQTAREKRPNKTLP